MDNLSGSAKNYYAGNRKAKKEEPVAETITIDPVQLKAETTEMSEMLDKLIKKVEGVYDISHKKHLHDMLTTLGMAKRDLKNLMN